MLWVQWECWSYRGNGSNSVAMLEGGHGIDARLTSIRKYRSEKHQICIWMCYRKIRLSWRFKCVNSDNTGKFRGVERTESFLGILQETWMCGKSPKWCYKYKLRHYMYPLSLGGEGSCEA